MKRTRYLLKLGRITFAFEFLVPTVSDDGDIRSMSVPLLCLFVEGNRSVRGNSSHCLFLRIWRLSFEVWYERLDGIRF